MKKFFKFFFFLFSFFFFFLFLAIEGCIKAPLITINKKQEEGSEELLENLQKLQKEVLELKKLHEKKAEEEGIDLERALSPSPPLPAETPSVFPAPPPPAPSPPPQEENPPVSIRPRQGFYTVRKGDTPNGVAAILWEEGGHCEEFRELFPEFIHVGKKGERILWEGAKIPLDRIPYRILSPSPPP